MFRALLRTIPSLSGNIKLSFDLDDYEDNNKEVVESNIRNGILLPLNSKYYKNNIRINLLQSSYDFDIHDYYLCYKNIFYNDNFSINKNDISLLDIYKETYLRNTDFEFGVKRNSYIKENNQFEFFAPVWIDSVNDIPDYFLIKLEIKNNSNNKTKYIKINIGENKTDNKNYIYKYLSKYLSKIDDNVIYCTPFTKQATYYGISLKYGGIGKFVDNEIGNIYNKFNTIINFDYCITSGFKRNELVIRQIIPLCYKFNVNNYLTDYEKELFENCEVIVSGKYYKDNKELDFYDFESNYTNFHTNIYKFNSNNGQMVMSKSKTNLFDINNFNILHESNYINYLFTNKFNKIVTKWKLKYSDDSNPYITNLNWTYSYIQNSNYKYGYFPQKYNYTTALATKITDENNIIKYNLIFPYGSTKSIYENILKSSVKDYETIMNNYCFNWFNVINKNTDIFSNKKYWKTSKEGKIYYRGILYNLNNINDLDVSKINRFGIFLNFQLNKVKSKEENNLIYSNYSININNNITNCNVLDNIYNYHNEVLTEESSYSYTSFYNINNIYYDKISENEIFIKKEDGTGRYIDINDYNIDYYNLNKYYNISEVINYIRTHTENIKDIYLENYENLLYKNSVSGYKLLDIYNFKSLENEDSNILTDFINDDTLNIENKRRYLSLFENIYFSEKDSVLTKNKFFNKIINGRASTTSFNLEDKDSLYSFNLFIKSNFISRNKLLNIFNNNKLYYFDEDYYKIEYNLLEFIPYFREYLFKPVLYYNGKEIIRNFFISNFSKKGLFYGSNVTTDKLKDYNDVIWVQPYNLNNVISYNNINHNKDLSYYTTNGGEYSSYSYININDVSKELYCKFLDLSHLKIYNQFTFKDINGNENNNNYLDRLYLRIRNINNEINYSYYYYDMNVYDYFIPFSELFKQEYLYNEYNELVFNIYDYIYFSKINNKFYLKDRNCLNNIFKDIPEYFDLFFKDKFIKLDENLMNLINISKNNQNEYKDIYLYILEKPEDYFNNINSKISIFNFDNEIYSGYNFINNKETIDCNLKPFFDDAQLQKMNVTVIYNNYILNKINEIKAKDSDLVLYKYNCNDVNILLKLPEEYNENNYINNLKISDIGTYDKYEESLLEISGDKEYNYLNIYEDDKTGLVYAYYLFNINITNTSNTFNVVDEYGNTVNIFNFVDSNQINKYEDISNNYILDNIVNLFPFIKLNLINVFNNINTITYPKLYEFTMNYKDYPISESYSIDDDTYTYDIKKSNNKSKINLLRYFDSITPYFIKTSLVNNSFNIKYKTKDINILKTGNYLNNNDCILYMEDLNINKYNGVKIFNNPEDYKQVDFIYYPLEYKHFNDNKIINLKESFSYEYKENIRYEDLLYLETKEKTLEIFEKCINKEYINSYDKDKILFLFNKYTVEYESYPVNLNISKTEKLYKLIYKFILL